MERDPNDVETRKILIHNLFSEFNNIKYSFSELARFIHSLKVLLRGSFGLLLITFPTTLNDQIKNLLLQNSDLSMKIDGILGNLFKTNEIIQIKGNNYFEDFQGILHFKNLPFFDSLIGSKIEAISWGIKTSSKRQVK